MSLLGLIASPLLVLLSKYWLGDAVLCGHPICPTHSGLRRDILQLLRNAQLLPRLESDLLLLSAIGGTALLMYRRATSRLDRCLLLVAIGLATINVLRPLKLWYAGCGTV